MKKKILLGTSDAWSMSCLPHRPSEPAYYIEDSQIFLSVFYAKLLMRKKYESNCILNFLVTIKNLILKL